MAAAASASAGASGSGQLSSVLTSNIDGNTLTAVERVLDICRLPHRSAAPVGLMKADQYARWPRATGSYLADRDGVAALFWLAGEPVLATSDPHEARRRASHIRRERGLHRRPTHRPPRHGLDC